jgi:hypothetical protein
MVESMTNKLGPLGLLASGVDKRTVDAIAKIEAFDLKRVRMSFIAEHPDQSPEVRLIERELKRFLSLGILIKSPKYETFVPSKVVDDLWHVFILHTRYYRDFCDAYLGGYVDHNPPEEGGRKQGLAMYAGELFGYTKEQLTAQYGHLPPAVWGITSRCDKPAPCVSWPSPHI